MRIHRCHTINWLSRLLFLFTFLLPFPGKAQQIAFNHLTVENGLSQNSVLAIAQDKTGFIWMGTRYGLNRYDGTGFRQYHAIKGDSTSLPENYILSLLCDSKGNFWVGTQAGLSIYQPKADHFRKAPPLPNPNAIALNSVTIHSIFEDRKGRIWIGTNHGLAVFDLDHPTLYRSLFNSFQVRTIFEDNRGNIWVGTSTGLLKVDTESEPFPFKHYQNKSITNDLSVTALQQAPDGKIWLATQHQGVFLFDPLNERFQSLSFKEGLPSNSVRKIISDQKGRFWIGTLEGIYLVDPLTLKGSILKNDPGNRYSLSQNSVHSIYRDKTGSIWVGTYFGGVNIAYSDNQPFQNFQAGNLPNSLSNNVVSSFQQDAEKNYWIGTEGGGLNYYDAQAGRFTHFKHQPDQPRSLGSNLVKSVYRDKNHRLWIGTHGGGINLYQPSTRDFLHFFHDVSNPQRFTTEFLDFEEDPWGRLWIAKNTGLLITRFAENKLEDETENVLVTPLNSHIKSILQGRNNRIWIGSVNGLYLALPDKEGKYRLQNLKAIKNPEWLKENINCLFEDSKGRLWIGKNYQGLLRYRPDSGVLDRITTQEGLPNNNILSIQEDLYGHIWVSTANGLVRIDPDSFALNSYTTNDGLPSNEYNYNASLLNADKELLFGSIKGFTQFNPAQIKNNQEKASIVFTNIRLFNKPVAIGDASDLLKQSVGFTKKISFGPDQSSFSIEFSLLNFIKPEKNKYTYKLGGLDNNWIETNSASASFTNLPSGSYTLWVKGANNDGTWSDPASLQITIRPPFWKSWWAYLLYAIGTAGIILLTTRYFFMQALLKKENDLHQVKLNFFTNVSHEIQTHLTLIMGPVENLIRLEKNNTVLQEKLATVKSNAERLLLLVRELLDFRKAETNHLQIRVSKQSLAPLIQDVLESMQEYIYAKKISCRMIPPVADLSAWIDAEQLKKVFFNLLINAVKFTPEKGKIEILLEQNESEILLTFRDNGKGIAPEFLPRLFSNFFQVNDHGLQNTGYGIGLALSKSIVELHKGTLSVTSRQASSEEPGSTSFIIRLQKGRNHFTDEQIQPALKPAQVSEPITATPDPIAEQPVSDTLPTLLVVDDNEEIRRLITESLGNQYRIIQEKNGAAGLEKAMSLVPDIIISDVMMPQLDGFSFCRILKTDARTSHIPVILLTAKTTTSEQVEGLETGADVYLTKPFSTRLLELQVNNLIQSREKLRTWFQHQLGSASKETIIQTISQNKTDETFLLRIVGLIEEHLDDPQFGVGMLAEKSTMSQTVLYRKIKSMTGQSINDFIKSVRLKKAARLLLQKELAVYEIAYAVGFSDRKYFSKEFKKVFGVNPTEYIEKNSGVV